MTLNMPRVYILPQRRAVLCRRPGAAAVLTSLHPSTAPPSLARLQGIDLPHGGRAKGHKNRKAAETQNVYVKLLSKVRAGGGAGAAAALAAAASASGAARPPPALCFDAAPPPALAALRFSGTAYGIGL